MFDSVKEFLSNFFKSRVVVLGIIMLLLSAILVQRVFYLQIINGAQYQENYSLTIEKTRSLNSTRGNIYDKKGKLLAYNELAYSVCIEDSGSYDTKSEKNIALNSEIMQILEVLDKYKDAIENNFSITLNEDGSYSYNVSENSLLRFLADIYGRKTITDEKFLKVNEKLGYIEAEATAAQVMEYLCTNSKYGYDLLPEEYTKEDTYRIVVIRRALAENNYQKYIATTISSNVSEETVAYVNEHLSDLQGVSVAEDTIRKYNYSEYISHIIGYTGKISQEEYDTLSEKDESYLLTDVVGKAGIEQVMDTTLKGSKGSETVLVDNLGRVQETTKRVEPAAGNDVYLSIDVELQEAVYHLLEQEIAGILYSKIENTREYNASLTSTASNIKIPIYDVYYALVNNNVIDISHFEEADASKTEKAVYKAFEKKQKSVLKDIKQQMTSSANTPYGDLTEEQQVYMTYIVTMLTDKEILLKDEIDKSDEVYQNWKNDKISLSEYLTYAIGQNWIDITNFSVDGKYADSTEIYDSLLEYILEELKTDRSFAKKIYKYIINDDSINGIQLCLILFDQGVLEKDSEAISGLKSGTKSAFEFLKEKIKNLEITPAQLALDPCSGSCVITDVNTGELLAVVSYPGYDNNKLANTVDSNYFRLLNEDLSLPQYDYATQQKTAPGSTFKMITATAGLTEGYITSTAEEIEDLGQFNEVANGPKCWIYPSSHGKINVSEAIRDSCNYFFYQVGYRMSMLNGSSNEEKGISAIEKYASLFGLNEKTGIEIPESEPHIATSYPITAAIGQSDNSYSTVQLGRYVTAVANSGTVYNYTLLSQVKDADGNVLETYSPTVRNTIDTVSSTTWDSIHSGMRMVVETHKQFDDFTINVAGKTGTAQQDKIRPNHALFVGYAPYENPKISIATRIAYGYDSANATYLAANVLKYYFDLEEESKLINGQAEEVGTTSTNTFND